MCYPERSQVVPISGTVKPLEKSNEANCSSHSHLRRRRGRSDLDAGISLSIFGCSRAAQGGGPQSANPGTGGTEVSRPEQERQAGRLRRLAAAARSARGGPDFQNDRGREGG